MHNCDWFSIHNGGTLTWLSLPLPTRRVIRGIAANLSVLAPRQGPLRLAGYPQLLVAPSGGMALMLAGGTLITRGFWQCRG